MKKALLVNIFCCLLVFMATGCSPNSSSYRVSNCAVKINQGVYGRVFWVAGNQMPVIGVKPPKEKSKADNQRTKPVKRQLLVYPVMSMSQLKPNGRLFQMPDTKPFATAMADEDGCFQLKLPPGKYSVFTLEEDQGQKRIFANIFDGQGHANPVEVKRMELTELNIKINYKAVF
ncbi:MAG TPA: hypothetical protein DCS93_24240 [Microscillaceae bacterium]|nr:hypothetical protein [Microscillaceae bacterium]